ncbi:sigma-70 family RNA polymerase sigma factor [Glycocaulis profundi]|nr:sigma-70 family RNA polymerase sigma factor [Glycocaulis profundi]
MTPTRSNVIPFNPPAMTDSQAVSEAVARFDGRLRAYFLRIMTPADAADAVQEVYARLTSAARRRPEGGFTASYVFSAADSVARDTWRRKRTRGGEHAPLTDRERSEMPSPFEEARWREAARRMQAALNALPPRQRRVLVMHRIDGISLVDIARQTGRPLRSVQRNLADALAACRERLEAEGWFDQ